MTTLAEVILVLYFLSGVVMWMLAIRTVGGKKGYMMYLAENYNHSPHLMFITAGILFTLFWPFFLVRGIINKDE